MSSRRAASSSGEDLAIGETSNGSRTSPSSQQRTTRRSNSAMSSTRARGGISKDGNDVEHQVNEGGQLANENVMTVEPGEEDETNENIDSGDSGNSAYQNSTTRSRRNASSSKRKRGGGNTTAASRTRAGKRSRQPTADDQLDSVGQEQSAIKSEAEEEAVDDSMQRVKSMSESGEDGMTRAGSKESTLRASRQRSASGIKELAGLGLRTLGNGEEEPLVPRRTRRGGNSPNEGQSNHKEGEEKGESGSEDSNGEDVKRNTSAEDKGSSKKEDTAEDDEVAEEGVTRCLCGSADENVGLMIQCETCKCWQHCICMGMRSEEDCPDVYFCEQCRPELHIDLLRLLGFLPGARNGKKGGSSKAQSGRISAKDAAKELKDAKDAVLSLGKENERRRKEGRDPVTGWSVAQEQEQAQLQEEQQQQHPSHSHQHTGGRSMSSGQHRRQASELQARASRSQSRDELNVPKSPPKRRSTMNSRDSAYGWEAIPPGLLDEDDEGEEGEAYSRKRKRGSVGEDGEVRSPSPLGLDSHHEGLSKKRKTSSAGMDEDDQIEGDEEEDEAIEDAAMTQSNSQGSRKASSKTRPSRDHDTSRPKHPNQYTARRAAAAAAAAAVAVGQSGVGNAGSSSPSPSPSKHRLADGSRRGTTLRDVISNGSRMATPTPGDHIRSSNPSTAWSMPDHLSHLAYLLPTNTGPEPLKVNVASTKGMTSTSHSKGAQSTAVKDTNSDRIIQASPQAFQVLSLVEPNTKIKYPGKRTTLGEMKKRVRNILDFVSRLQVESAERERRMKFLGISAKDTSQNDTPEEDLESANEVKDASTAVSEAANIGHEGTSEEFSVKLDENSKMKVEEEGVKTTSSSHSASPTANDTLAADTSHATSTGSSSSENSLKRFTKLHSSSMSLVDELTRELLTFQQRYGTGASSSAVMASSSSAY